MKLFIKISGFIVLFVIIASLIQHLVCPVYDYPSEKVFTGNNLYNPYSDISSKKRIKANLHAHSRTWMGITNGRKNDNESLVQRYKFLMYDIAGISDYQSINRFQKNEPLYIPEYEHGFGFSKNHQLSIGTEDILWNDYLFFQTTDNKQNILKQLRDRSLLLAIAHPSLRNAYNSDDMKKLTDYDCIEILNNENGNSIDLWDAALSSGHSVWCLGDDDSHNSENPHDIGCCFNVVYCDTLSSTNIINSIKSGRSFVVEQHAETMEIKQKKARNLPILLSLDVIDGKIDLKLDKISKEIDFIGQDGVIKNRDFGKNEYSYQIKSEDTYVRTAIYFEDSTKFYLNPVLKTTNGTPQFVSARVNTSATLILRLVSGIILGALLVVFIYYRFKKRSAKPSYAKAS